MRNLVVLYLFSDFERKKFGFCQIFWLGFQNCNPRAQRILTSKICKFFQKIFFTFVFGFWAFGFWETIRHVRTNCLLRIQKNIWVFFKNVFGRIVTFRIWSRNFLPPSGETLESLSKLCFTWPDEPYRKVLL